MPANMTPEVAVLLASFGNPKLRLKTPAQMITQNRKQAATHAEAIEHATDIHTIKWRVQLFKNAIRRAESFSHGVKTTEGE